MKALHRNDREGFMALRRRDLHPHNPVILCGAFPSWPRESGGLPREDRTFGRIARGGTTFTMPERSEQMESGQRGASGAVTTCARKNASCRLPLHSDEMAEPILVEWELPSCPRKSL